MNESIEEVTYRYRKKRIGRIAKVYSPEEEQSFYEDFANNISNKYGNIISKERIIEIISKRGRIFSLASMGKRCGFFEYATGNVGVNKILISLSDDLSHELVHKLGYFQNNNFFKNMSQVFLESGTEIVSARSLSSQISRVLIFENAYAIFPDRVSDNYLAVNFTNQINEALGENTLESTILTGNNIFEQKIKDRWGEDALIYLKENIEDIVALESLYWENRQYLSSEQKQEEQHKLLAKVSRIQDFILEKEFNLRLSSINNYLEAQNFLRQLLEFGNTRIKNREITVDKESVYTDSSFRVYFSKCRDILEKKYGKIGNSFDERNWSTLCKYKEIEAAEENNDILILADKFAKNNKRKGKFRKIFKRICGLDESMLTLESPKKEKIDNYRVTIKEKINSNANIKEYKEYNIEK